MKRILTAIVALPVLLYTVWSDTPYYFAALTAISVLIGLYEFYSLASRLEIIAQKTLGCVAGLAVVACFTFNRPALIAAVLSGLVIVSLSILIFQGGDLGKAMAIASVTVLGVLYVALLAGALIGVRMLDDAHTVPATPKLAAKLLTTFFAMVMLTDTGAYYTGRAIGRHKLAPRVSPGKTIEGSVGGFISSALAGVACREFFFHEIPLLHVISLGVIIGIVGQIGDLAESMLKRGAGVKDSGAIFPGHGGMLDRIDSLLFCAPIIYYYSQWFL
jgi:phosphatidate cytidylyltransferase